MAVPFLASPCRFSRPNAALGLVCTVATIGLLGAVPTSAIAQTYSIPPPTSFLQAPSYAAAEPATVDPNVVFPSNPEPPSPPGRPWRLAELVRGRSQLEFGYSYVRQSFSGTSLDQHVYPDMLLRFGLTPRLELRLGWPGKIDGGSVPSNPPGWIGTTPSPNIGFMLDVWPQYGPIPQTAVLATAPIPLTGNPFATNSLQPLAQVLYGWSITDRIWLDGATGYAIYQQRGDRYGQFQQTVAVTTVLSSRWSTFLYWEFLVNRGSSLDGPQHMAGGGATLLLNNRIGVSWRAGFALNPAAPDFLTDVRVSYRF